MTTTRILVKLFNAKFVAFACFGTMALIVAPQAATHLYQKKVYHCRDLRNSYSHAPSAHSTINIVKLWLWVYNDE